MYVCMYETSAPLAIFLTTHNACPLPQHSQVRSGGRRPQLLQHRRGDTYIHTYMHTAVRATAERQPTTTMPSLTVVRGKGQGGEDHALDVCAAAGVVLVRP